MPRFNNDMQAIHFGSHPDNLPAFERFFGPDLPLILDGDGWESWGEKPGTDSNDPSTLHVIVFTSKPNSHSSNLAVSGVAQFLVPMANQGSETFNGVTITVTPGDDWSEATFFYFGERKMFRHELLAQYEVRVHRDGEMLESLRFDSGNPIIAFDSAKSRVESGTFGFPIGEITVDLSDLHDGRRVMTSATRTMGTWVLA